MSRRTQKYNRWKIFERDHGICQVCKRPIWKIEEEYGLDNFYECGHIIDWMISQDDSDDNLVVMCSLCNQFKPIHETRDEYEKWVNNGGVVAGLKNHLKEHADYVLETGRYFTDEGWEEPLPQDRRQRMAALMTEGLELPNADEVILKAATQYFIWKHYV